MMSADSAEVYIVASEHVAWCRKIGLTPWEIVKMFAGQAPLGLRTTWDDAHAAIAIAWMAIPKRYHAEEAEEDRLPVLPRSLPRDGDRELGRAEP